MILLLTLKPAAVWAAEDQKQEETEVPEESRTQEDRELNQVAAEVSAPHALLMEVSTGTVLMEKAADEKVHPASVTKIMTLLLISGRPRKAIQQSALYRNPTTCGSL